MTVDHKLLEINGVTIAYHDHGKGQPVVLVHGYGTFSFSWTYLLEKIPKNRRYITLDLQGFGYSEKPSNIDYSPYAQAKLLTTFINQLNLENVVLIGHSFGGAIILLALFSPDRKVAVSGLILIDSAGYYQQLPGFLKKLRIPLLSSIGIRLISEWTMTQWTLNEVFYDRSKIRDELVQEYSKILKLPGAKKSFLKSARQVLPKREALDELQANFKRISVPTLLIWGQEDKVIPVENAYKFQKDIPHAELRIITNCGHAPQEECPGETINLIENYLSRFGAR
jgi:pimeloyl-ACP methyl ester carboxylesterase